MNIPFALPGQVVDYFTPSNEDILDNDDLDFGSAALIPVNVSFFAIAVDTGQRCCSQTIQSTGSLDVFPDKRRMLGTSSG